MSRQSGLQSLRQVYGDGNVRVREFEARIASLQAQLAKMIGPSSPPAADGMRDASMNTSADDQNELYPPLRQLPGLAVSYTDLYRRVQVQEAVFQLLTQQYETARIEEAKDTPAVMVIDPPALPEKKSFPPTLAFKPDADFSFVCRDIVPDSCAPLLVAMAPADPRKGVRTRNPSGSAPQDSFCVQVQTECRMRKHLTNAGYGVLDYVSYTAGDAARGARRSAQARCRGVRLVDDCGRRDRAGGIIAPASATPPSSESLTCGESVT